MDTLRLPASLASLVAANIAPLVGILLLGWSPLAILVLYFVDTLLSLGVVMLLVMLHVTGNGKGRACRLRRTGRRRCSALLFLGAIFAFPLSLPLWIVGPETIAAEFARPDGGLGYGVLLQARHVRARRRAHASRPEGARGRRSRPRCAGCCT